MIQSVNPKDEGQKMVGEQWSILGPETEILWMPYLRKLTRSLWTNSEAIWVEQQTWSLESGTRVTGALALPSLFLNLIIKLLWELVGASGI